MVWLRCHGESEWLMGRFGGGGKGRGGRSRTGGVVWVVVASLF